MSSSKTVAAIPATSSPFALSLRRATRFTAFYPLVGLIVVSIVMVFASDSFLSYGNITNIVRQVSINALIAVGMTFVILTGGIDLSVGAVMALCAVVAGSVLKLDSLSEPAAIGLGILASLGVGMLCGALNGFVSAFWGVPSFIVTLGMLNVARGGALEVTNARTTSRTASTPSAA